MLKIDLHTHTIASGHAFNTIYEMAKVASEKGVEILGITDHGPSSVGGPPDTYFECLNRVPRELFGIKLLFGIEMNVLDDKGNIDLSDEILDKLDFASVGLHHHCPYEDLGEDLGNEKNTKAMIAVMKNSRISIINHIYKYSMEVGKIAQAACDKGKLLAIGTSAFERGRINEEAMAKIKEMVKVVKKNNFKILLGSDAHVESELAVDGVFRENMDRLGLTDDDIANNDIEYLRKFIKNI